VGVPGESGKESKRKFIEANAIALLSNFNQGSLEGISSGWLGRFSSHLEIMNSGLWNVQQVRDRYNPSFLDVLAEYIDRM